MPAAFQLFARREIEIRGGFFVGDKVRVIARSSGDQFAAQPRIFVHFEHVDAHVRGAGRERFCRATAARFRRSGAASPAIRSMLIFVIPAARRRAMSSSTVARLCKRPTAAASAIDERLHAQADAIHAAAQQALQHFRAQRSRRALDRDFRIRTALEIACAPRRTCAATVPASSTVGVPPPR